MQVNSLKVFVPKLKTLLISGIIVLTTTSCSTNNHYFQSNHIDEHQKAAFLNELVNSLELTPESQLIFGLYGNWGFSLTPLDLDRKSNGKCVSTIFRGGKHRKRRDLRFYNFFSDVFDRDVAIMSRRQNDCGYELYLEGFVDYPQLNEATHMALLRFKEIAERLEDLHFDKLDLIEKYDGIDHLVSTIDDDMASLSEAGYKLGESTKRFFQLAKVQLAMQDVANVRSKSLGRLKTFSSSLEKVKHTQFKTIEDATMATIKALEDLKKDINQ